MPTEVKIPFVKPYFTGRESAYVSEVITSGKIASDGRFTRACASLLQERFGIHRVLMTPSCTAALEMAAMLCELQPGDEVILPSYTFVSTANAVVQQGARPVFVDIRPDTLNLDERLIERAITTRTKAIFPVHYAGVGCEMDAIGDIATRHRLKVVEDAAQGVQASYRGRALGSLGHLAAYSFHETKNYICGEGGALCINDPSLVERAEILREKGTDRSKFHRGQVDKYTWVDVGSSYLPSEIACAFLYAQLEQLEDIDALRREVCQRYQTLLQPLAEKNYLQLPIVPLECTSNHHMFYFLVKDGTVRERLLAWLRERGITAVFHYVPLHSSPMGKRLGLTTGALPVTDSLSERLVRLPLYCELTAQDQAWLVEQVAAFFK